MAQSYEFKVVGISAEADKDEVKLHGKFHPVYTSQLFLKVPTGELSKFSIGQIYSLVAQDAEEDRIESMVLANEPCPDCGSRHHRSCARTDIPAPSPDMWDDGSPIHDDNAAAIERRGGYRL